jgi:folylpolyglutamate synthase/dihydropteroate synthase
MQNIDAYFPSGKRVFLFSMLSEKDWQESVDLIAQKADVIVLTKVPSLRASDTDAMRERLESFGVHCICIDDYAQAYHEALSLAGTGGNVFVFGSLYLAGALRVHVEN